MATNLFFLGGQSSPVVAKVAPVYGNAAAALQWSINEGGV